MMHDVVKFCFECPFYVMVGYDDEGDPNYDCRVAPEDEKLACAICGDDRFGKYLDKKKD